MVNSNAINPVAVRRPASEESSISQDAPPPGTSASDELLKLNMCRGHVIFTYPAIYFEKLTRWMARRCLKIIVTGMGYYNHGYLESYRWILRTSASESMLQLHFDEVVTHLLTLWAVICGLVGVCLAFEISENTSVYAFVIGYTTCKVCMEPLAAAVTTFWIASLNGDTRHTTFDNLLRKSNRAIERMIKSSS